MFSNVYKLLDVVCDITFHHDINCVCSQIDTQTDKSNRLTIQMNDALRFLDHKNCPRRWNHPLMCFSSKVMDQNVFYQNDGEHNAVVNAPILDQQTDC